jgi:prephenate dehydrogenase
VGLIGGSFALALKQNGCVQEIIGMGRSPEPLKQAQALGVIDTIAQDWAHALHQTDLVLIAAPVAQTGPLLQAMAPHLSPHTLITDAGSTKSDVVAAFYAHLPQHLAQIVPAHPIAGAEKSGVSAAQATLYQGKKVILTPLPESSPGAIQTVQAAWAACGADIHTMPPNEHDAVFAAVSHLPHLAAYALVHDLAKRPNAEQLFRYAASGFRDFTRIAGSHPEMWRDICLANRSALLTELTACIQELQQLQTHLTQNDAPAIEAIFDYAQRARNAWGSQQS